MTWIRYAPPFLHDEDLVWLIKMKHELHILNCIGHSKGSFHWLAEQVMMKESSLTSSKVVMAVETTSGSQSIASASLSANTTP